MSTALLTPPHTPSSSAPTTPLLQKRFSSYQTSLPTPPYTPEATDAPLKRLSLLSTSSSASRADESERLLSDNELSYFLPSRADGVNDMYLHHRLTAPAHLMNQERVAHLWALQLLRHPLLASHISFRGYNEVSFVHPTPSSVSSALESADERYVYLDQSEAEIDIIDTYLNGPRSLASDRLAMLVVADKGEGKYEMMLCATHYLGDGMALHTFMNEFYTLLGSDATIESLVHEIRDEITRSTGIPPSLEDRMPKVGNGSSFAKAIGAIDNKRNDSKLIGGQAFPGSKVKRARHTVVPTFAYSAQETKTILGKCKTNGATIAHAMFALCNVAWARRVEKEKRADPCLIYSALNLRPNMLPSAEAESSYFHLAVGYFNIVLPTLLPADLSAEETFWHRARETKKQTVKAVKSQFVVARSRETNKIRRDRAVKWAKIDDEEEAKKAADGFGLGLGVVEPARKAPVPEANAVTLAAGPKIAPIRAEQPTPITPPNPSTPKESNVPVLPPASQRALMGVSMLGNLDGMYKHAAFGEIALSALTTGSRQRQGGLLLFAYTFAGKLWMSLGYDENGFEEGVIPGFWQEVQDLVQEVLL